MNKFKRLNFLSESDLTKYSFLRFKISSISLEDKPKNLGLWSVIPMYLYPLLRATSAISSIEFFPRSWEVLTSKFECICRSPFISFKVMSLGILLWRAFSISSLPSLNSGGMYCNPIKL